MCSLVSDSRAARHGLIHRLQSEHPSSPTPNPPLHLQLRTGHGGLCASSLLLKPICNELCWFLRCQPPSEPWLVVPPTPVGEKCHGSQLVLRPAHTSCPEPSHQAAHPGCDVSGPSLGLWKKLGMVHPLQARRWLGDARHCDKGQLVELNKWPIVGFIRK